jgi:RNA polymerase sigma-70 factor (ECF subfamily)
MPAPDELDIQTAIRKVRDGDKEAFRRVVKVHALPLRAFLAGRLYHLDDVDDLAQDCFITAFENLERFRDGEDFGAWLRGIARNKLMTHFRTLARRKSAMERFRDEIAEALDSDHEKLAANLSGERIERLLRCITELPEKMRRIVRAGLEGRRAAELALELGMSSGALYTMNHRANKLLRACMEKSE